MYRMSTQGYELIKRFESLRTTAYRCPAGVLTIGYGHTGRDVAEGMRITANQAAELLKRDVARFEEAVNEMTTVALKQGQFDALVSIAFNIGATALKGSTLLSRVNKNPDDKAIRAEFMKWNKARTNGTLTTLPGLTTRRSAEADLYYS